MAIQTTTHDDILRHHAPQPPEFVTIDEPTVQSGGSIWRGSFEPSDNLTIELLALTASDGWVEVKWSKPTTTIGVQFNGDSNDGWARILVDGKELWTENTYGSRGNFRKYVELSGLPQAPHTVRVEATGEAGTQGGGAHVTVSAFGWGAVSSAGQDSTIFMPVIMDK
ncbi:MAG: hypothetical protein AAF702_17915 [Chloroflexota bacterium]